MALYIVTATNHYGKRMALWRGRLVDVKHATVFIQSPGVAKKAMEKAAAQYETISHAADRPIDWKVEEFKGEPA